MSLLDTKVWMQFHNPQCLLRGEQISEEQTQLVGLKSEDIDIAGSNAVWMISIYWFQEIIKAQDLTHKKNTYYGTEKEMKQISVPLQK